jgi:hypothetical protein
MVPRNPQARNRETVLDNDLVFAVLLVTSSMRKMTAWMMTHGIYNPYKGGPFTQMGLYRSAERSEKFLEFRHRRDVRHEIEGEQPDDGELAWAVACIDENLPKVIEHIRVLEIRLSALKHINDLPKAEPHNAFPPRTK